MPMHAPSPRVPPPPIVCRPPCIPPLPSSAPIPVHAPSPCVPPPPIVCCPCPCVHPPCIPPP
ncbi:hypothetical protein ID866_13128, partial [Astraeus odoratus]